MSSTCTAALLPCPAAIGLAHACAGAQELESWVTGKVNLAIHQIFSAKLPPICKGLEGRTGACEMMERG